MDTENKIILSLIIVLLLATFSITKCTSEMNAQDQDMKKAAIAKNCSYVGDGKVFCPVMCKEESNAK